MPTELGDFEHQLTTEEDPSISLVFGHTSNTYVTTQHPQITGGDDRFGDVELEREDGISFGEDYQSGKTIVFDIAVLTDKSPDPHVAGADALEVFEAAWKNPRLRTNAQYAAVLRSRMVPGRTRIAYGRPRRYAEETSRASHKGVNSILCEFQTIDGKWYSDVPQGSVCYLGEPFEGGFTTPLIAPITTTPIVKQSSSLQVNGTTATWPVVTIYGPVTKPLVVLGPLTIGFKGSIPDGESLVFDPRPWKRTVLRSDGANFAGELTWDTPPMRLCTLPPGAHLFDYSGFDLSGTSWAQVEWRDAYTRW